MPAAAVIPAPIAYIKVVAVKTLVVEPRAARTGRGIRPRARARGRSAARRAAARPRAAPAPRAGRRLL